MSQGDKRYQRTEEALLLSYSKIIKKGPSKLTPSNVSRQAGISRSTLHRHYRDLDEIFWKQKAFQVHRAKIQINRLKRKKLSRRIIIKNILLNIYHNHTYFSLDLASCNAIGTREIFRHLYGKDSSDAVLFSHCAIAHLNQWRSQRFTLDLINKIADQILSDLP